MLKSRYFMKIDWNIFQERRCLYCSAPFFPKKLCTLHTKSNEPNPKYASPIPSITSISTIYNHANIPHETSPATNNNFTEIETYILTHLCPECACHIHEKTSGYCKNCGEIFNDPTIIRSHCGQCEHTLASWESLNFFAPYENIFRELILKAKFNQSRACLKFLGELLALFIIKRFPNEQYFHFIPMPLHEKRLKERGYNQCLEILKFSIAFLKRHNIPAYIHNNILRKKFFTLPQSSLDKKARQKNIKNSFIIQNTTLELQYSPIFLFDDIVTTGSTLQEACNELKINGFKHIHVIALAKA